MSIKLVAIDLDDTLLDSELKIAGSCIDAIRRVQAQGVLVTLATGRMYRSALPYAGELKMDVPLITYQGALVKNSISKEVLYNVSVPRELALEVMGYFKDKGIYFQTYFNDQLCMESMGREGRYYSELAGIEPVIVKDLIAAARQEDTPKILAVIYDKKMLLDMEQELRNHYGQELNITRSKPLFLEIMSRSADKSNALQVVASHYGIKREEVLAVGDSYNDLEMIKWAGVGVAMGNARDIVKEAADYVTFSNEEDGVAEALHRFILNAEN